MSSVLKQQKLVMAILILSVTITTISSDALLGYNKTKEAVTKEVTADVHVSKDIKLDVMLNEKCDEVNSQVVEGNIEESVIADTSEPVSVSSTVETTGDVTRGSYDRYKSKDIDAAVQKAVDEKIIKHETLNSAVVDENYRGTALKFTGKERELLERLVMGEAGGQGFEGAALVAQCIRDTIVSYGYSSVSEVREVMSYSGSIKKEPNQDVLDAVKFIFDEGGYIVKHRVVYFYNPAVCSSSFHESQLFVIEHGSHRVFDRRD